MLINKTTIDVREDGVYIIIDQKSKSIKEDIDGIIHSCRIKDINYTAIEIAIREGASEVLVSSNKDIVRKNETVDVLINEDKMKASIMFEAPVGTDSFLTFDDILTMLNGRGVKHGIDEELLRKLIDEKEYGMWYEIAFGTAPGKSIDGYIEYFFNTEKKTLKPKELADGTVDYRNIDFFEVCEDGKTLAIAHPHIQGSNGIAVNGKVIPATKPKRMPTIPKGKNTSILEDGVTLVADTAGRILYADGRVNILPVLEIMGNVDNTTGNIDFLGSVVIKGSVLSGFVVKAGDSIEVEGAVEGATLVAVNNIVLTKGVQGGGNAIIEAGQDVVAKFIEMSTVSAGRDITANAIMHSTIRCDNILTLQGKKGLLVGGKATVGKKIEAKTIGSHMSTVTELEVGIFPRLLDKYKTLVNTMESLTKEYDKCEKVITTLSAQDIATLPDVKKKFLMDAIRTKLHLKAEINEKKVVLDDVLSKLNTTSGVTINASQVIYPGVKVTISNAVMYVRDDLSFCSLYCKDGKVCIGTHA